MSPYYKLADGKLIRVEEGSEVEIWLCPRVRDVKVIDLLFSAYGKCSRCGEQILYERQRNFTAPKVCSVCGAEELHSWLKTR